MFENFAFALSAILWCASFAWLIGTVCCALLQPTKRRLRASLANEEAVSIVVPTSAVDNDRTADDRTNALKSLLALKYPNYEIVVCVDRAQEGRGLRDMLERSFAGSAIRIVAAERESGANAKIDAMDAGLAESKNDLLLFSDDDVLVAPDHLAHLVGHLRGDIGLVSAAAFGIQPQNFWGHLECAFMNGQFARLHLAGDFVGYSGALGKTIMVRRGDLERAGGLLPTGVDCCEDAALTQNVKTSGARVVLSDQPVLQPILEQRFIDVWRRHRRWLSCRRKYLPVVFACEALFSMPVAALSGAIVANGLNLAPELGAVATAIVLCLIDSTFVLASGWHFGLQTPLAYVIRELVFLPLWVSALFARTVTWYGRRVPVAV